MTTEAQHDSTQLAEQATAPADLGRTPVLPAEPPAVGGRHPRPSRVWIATVVLLSSAVFGGAAGVITARVFEPDSTSQTAGAPPPPREDLATMLTRVSVSVVDIETVTTGTAGRQTRAGSGFVIDADGLIATNAHVISDAATITVTFADSISVTGTVVGQSTTDDLAVVQVPLTGLDALPFADSDEVQVGDFVIAIGNALALEGSPTVSVGIVSALDRSITTDEGSLTGLLQTSAGISSGDSGGPLLTPSGAVIGINTVAAKGDTEIVAEDIGFAVTSNVAEDVLTDLAKGQ